MKPNAIRSFSLIELLASIAVLAILGLLLSQITTSIVRSTRQSTGIIDASSQARTALDRLSVDLAGLVKRRDVDFITQNFTTASPNPVLLFLSSATPTTSSRNLSLISYELSAPSTDNLDAAGNPRPCLIRASKNIPWTSSGTTPNAGFMGFLSSGVPLSFTNSAFPSALFPSKTSDYQVLSSGVIRMAVAFQLYPDNKAVTLQDNYTLSPNFSRGQIVYSPPVRTLTSTTGTTANYTDLNRVSALIVGLVVIDSQNMNLMDATQIKALGDAFPTPNDGDNKTPVQAWTGIADSPNSFPGSLPVTARQSIRVFERTFPITPFTTQSP